MKHNERFRGSFARMVAAGLATTALLSTCSDSLEQTKVTTQEQSELADKNIITKEQFENYKLMMEQSASYSDLLSITKALLSSHGILLDTTAALERENQTTELVKEKLSDRLIALVEGLHLLPVEFRGITSVIFTNEKITESDPLATYLATKRITRREVFARLDYEAKTIEYDPFSISPLSTKQMVAVGLNVEAWAKQQTPQVVFEGSASQLDIAYAAQNLFARESYTEVNEDAYSLADILGYQIEIID